LSGRLGPAVRAGAGHAALYRQDLAAASAEYERVVQKTSQLRARREQLVIDAEVRETRRLLLQALRRRHGAQATAFLDEDFLAVGDRPVVVHAILVAAVTAGGADACDLQLRDPRTAQLRVEACRGFSDDPGRGPVFRRPPRPGLRCAAGFEAVLSYPLLDAAGEVCGVLSLYYRHPPPSSGGADLVAAGAARALRKLPAAR
jgi:hypothetical protein